PGRLSSRLRTLDLFAQYALQYLLRKREGIESITWLKLGNSVSPRSVNRKRTLTHWGVMCSHMGDNNFDILQSAIRAAGLKGFTGEPDLFCWDNQRHWFFAEAKLRDSLSENQRKWIEVCRKAFGERADVRMYRLVPKH